nr:uncharacterized protein [Tanacetum cinerariifolium]
DVRVGLLFVIVLDDIRLTLLLPVDGLYVVKAIASPNQRRDLLQALFAYVALQVDDRARGVFPYVLSQGINVSRQVEMNAETQPPKDAVCTNRDIHVAE